MASRFTRLAVAAPKLTRGYAAAKSAPVKTPIDVFGVGGRYASAIYSSAVRQSALEPVEKDLNTITKAVEKDATLKAFLENPTINRNQKMEGIMSILKKSGKPNQLTLNFFETLAENGRLDHTSKITEAFAQIMSAHRNELPLVITSAKALDKSYLNKIVESLQQSKLAEGKKLIVSNKVKPDILGGLLVEIGDKSIDLTVSSKLAKLNKLVTDSV